VEAAYRQFAARRAQFVDLLKRHRLRLEALYASGAADEAKRAGKAEIFASLQAEYLELKAQWGGFSGYDRWFGQQLGNAHLAAVATYTALVPGFRRLLAEQDGDMQRFYDVVRRLAREDKGQRDRMLARAVEGEPRDAPRMTLSSSD
jgi:predicted aminopeptidase